MTKTEEDFLKKLRETFYSEAQEHIAKINCGILEIEHSGIEGQSELIDTIFREAHNLKGGARAVNHAQLQNICQSLETVLSAVRQNTIELSTESFDILYSTLDLIRKILIEEDGVEGNEEVITLAIDRLELIAKGTSPKPSTSSTQGTPSKREKEKKSLPIRESSEKFSDSTVRVSTRKLDILLRQIEEILVIKLTSKQRLNELKSILKYLEGWSKERKYLQKDIQLLTQWTKKLSPLEKKLVPLHSIHAILEQYSRDDEKFKDLYESTVKVTRQTDHDSRISGTIIDNLLEDTKDVLLQPFSTIIEAFPMMVRDIAKQLEKKVILEIEGEHIEIDKRILEELKDPLIHILRNCIDHGLESPQKREALGKSSEGKVKIVISEASGNNVNIRIFDDGRGVDIDALKRKAIENNVAIRSDIEKMADSDAIKLMFLPGVSTSEIITDLSGRGLGVGIVVEKVEKLGGKINVTTEKNIGTTFEIEIPVTLATFRGVYIRSGGQDFIIPTHYLIRALCIKTGDIITLEGKKTFFFEGANLPYVNLNMVLGINSENTLEDKKHVLILKASELTIALGIDNIVKEQEVFIKGLGGQFSNIKNIATATVMEWGKVIPILDPLDLVHACDSSIETMNFSTRKSPTSKDEKPTILVAEDTVTARMLLKNILESAGYQVKTAVDGAEAYSILLQQKVHLLLSDIEMPRMNGFELTEKVRENEKLKETPIILCTSLSTKSDQEKGIAAGANAYIIKSSFEQSNLLETIQKLL